jgi:hypothetical protein
MLPSMLLYIPRLISGRKQSKDGVLNFACTNIQANIQHCTSKYMPLLLKNFTEDIFNSYSIINMGQHCGSLVGAIPRCTKATNSNSNCDAIYSGFLILHKSVETMSRTP